MMSDQQRQALAVLEEIWELSPDIRSGQLFAHLGFLGEVHLGRGLGYIDDDELMSILCRHRAELLARLDSTPNQVKLQNRSTKAVNGTEPSSPGNPVAGC